MGVKNHNTYLTEQEQVFYNFYLDYSYLKKNELYSNKYLIENSKSLPFSIKTWMLFKSTS